LSTPKQPPQKLKEGIKGDTKFGKRLTMPAQIFVNVVVIFPILATLYLSFTEWGPLTGYGTKWYSAYKFWNWGANYWYLITDIDFLLALLRTAIIVVVVVPIEFVLGFLLAFLFLDKFPFKKILHTIILTPMMMIPAVSGFIFYMLFVSKGPINAILSMIFQTTIEFSWLKSGVGSMAAVMIADIWQWTPFMFLVILSGLMSLPEDQRDAAIILGASKWQRFWMITIPLLKPVLLIAFIIRGIEAIKIFDPIMLMTRGGPGTATETISVYLYKKGFQAFQWSYVAAAGLVVLIIITIISIYALKPLKPKEERG
jgi:multiple sugar transport system permease protein